MVAGVVTLLFLARGAADPEPAVGRDPILELQAKFVVGGAKFQQQAASILDQGPEQADLLADFRGRGDLRQRLMAVLLDAEITDRELAREEYSDLKALVEVEQQNGWEPSERESELLDAVDKLLASDPATVDALSENDLTILVTQLGWVGELALVPPGSDSDARSAVLAQATRVTVVAGVAFLLVFALGALGLAALFALMAFFSAGWTKRHFRPARMSATRSIQIFAVWILLFLGLQLGATAVAGSVPRAAPFVNLAAFFGSAVALFWPILRGERWSDVRSDLGLYFGRNPFVESVAAGWGFCMMIPFMMVGVIGTVLLSSVVAVVRSAPEGLDPIETASHPIVPEMLAATTPERIALFLLAAVAAPFVEEIFFRGALYRHFRAISRPAGIIVSVGFSTIFTSVIFAAVHPQGLIAIPALTGIACGITVLREWRDSLFPCMIVHGLWNGLLLTTLFQLV